MANTKSAERRMRSSARKRDHNRRLKGRLKTLEAGYRSLLAAGKKDEAAQALRKVQSAFDKAAKAGVIHKATSSRKKSRLATALKPAQA
jgi:small subunit ribosomal protein S20